VIGTTKGSERRKVVGEMMWWTIPDERGGVVESTISEHHL